MKVLRQIELVRHNLRRKPVRTGMLMAVVALFAFTLFCGTIVGKSVSNGTKMMAERLGADVLFVPYGANTQLQNSLLRGEPSSFYLDAGFGKDLAGEKSVDKATSQLFIATLKAACCTLPVQLIGIDPETDFVVKPWMQSVLEGPLGETQVVVGSKIFGTVGEKISLFGKEFTIAARLDPTGMGFDTSVFLDINRARRLLLLSDLGPMLNLPEGMDKNTFVSSTLVKFVPGADIKQSVNALSQKYAATYNLDFVVVAGMITDIASRLDAMSLVFYALSGMLWVLALGILALVFSVIIQERKKEFGLLRIIGASRGALAAIVLKEALIISSVGAALGLSLACLTLFPFSAYIDSVLNLPTLRPGFMLPAAVGLGVFVLGMSTGPLACLPAAWRLGRLDVYAAVREEA